MSKEKMYIDFSIDYDGEFDNIELENIPSVRFM